MRSYLSPFFLMTRAAALTCFLALASQIAVAQPSRGNQDVRGEFDASFAPVDGPKANPSDASAVRPGADPVLPGIPEPVAALIRDGQFAKAVRQLESLRADADKPGAELDARAIDWQIEKLRRYREDYPDTRPELLKALAKRVRDFKEPELDQWIAQGLVDRMTIDNEERFADPTVSNLFFLSAELRARKVNPGEKDLEQYVAKLVERLEKTAAEEKGSIIEPRRWRVSGSFSAKTPPERDGQSLRLWVPFPREFPFIENIQIIRAEPEPVKIADGQAAQRTVHFEKTTRADTPTSFGLIYEFTAYSRVNKIADHIVEPLNPDSPIAREWTREEAHVRFTPEMRKLYDEIAGTDRNPARLARKFYVWISNNIRYSYAREYSTLDDIGLYTAARRTGDCGQEALLFITLCRMAGIPARWQSGWTIYPDWTGIHDWTEIYLEPYGWIPVDPYMGIWATRYIDSLTPEQKRQVRDFYFGSMDAHRLPANAAHSAKFDPPKKGFRSDDVDNQRAEMEWADGANLYFGDYKRSVKITPAEGKE